MKIIIINGPNLNLTGSRETEIYGNTGFEPFMNELKKSFKDVEFHYFQSNIEGEIIDKLQETGFSFHGIILNAGGYSHTSVAIADAIVAIKTTVIEVHLSNIYSRETFRHVSLTAKNCKGLISGFGMDSYKLAVNYLTNLM
ncbi:MAG: 3-dehydroquinate dehydratase [Bacteroidetes bacterium]|nr:3-dehydroquinate dehydratase [Bacteroidota bacterium]HET6243021.1 type II 3-dehydroquinate dehydratase [Bacteroidia bacterium]